MFLDRIMQQKRLEVSNLRDQQSMADLTEQALAAPPPRDLVSALNGCPHVPIIAEIKRASPSEGRIREAVRVDLIAGSYRRGGAMALSVLTDGLFFGGSLRDLEESRKAVDLPVLRKDFILDPIQIYESRIAGTDAVLLIAAALTATQLRELYQETLELGMTPLVEVHREEELAKVLELNPPLLGINNRDLLTLEVSLQTCARLRPQIPSEVLVVGESGIKDIRDLEYLLAVGVDAFLIGTTLMRSPEPEATLRELCHARRR